MRRAKPLWLGIGGTAAALLLVGGLAQGQSASSRPSRPKPKSKPEFPPLADVIKDMTALESTPQEARYYNLYYDLKKSRILAEIPGARLNKNFLLYTSIAGGGAYTGWQWDDVMVKWVRRGKKLLLVKPQVRYKGGGSELGELVKRTYRDSIITTVPILAMGKKGGPVIDLGALFGAKASIFVGSLASGTTASLMEFPPPKAFKENVEIELHLPRIGGSVSSVGGGLTVHYSLSALPSTGYKPRAADDRVGYFLTAMKDFSKDPKSEDRFVRYINRWHLEKDDPKAKVSLAKNPIIFYVEKTVPKQYRAAVHAGIEEWNKAFEKIGILKAIEVRQQTATNEFKDLDPEDRRYNFFRWVTNERGMAMGPSRVHPQTGQIFDADIIMDDDFVRFFLEEYDLKIKQGRTAELSPRLQKFLKTQPWRHPMRRWIANDPVPEPDPRDVFAAQLETEFPHRFNATCQIGDGMRHQLVLGLTAHEVLFSARADDDDKDKDKDDDDKDKDKDDDDKDKDDDDKEKKDDKGEKDEKKEAASKPATTKPTTTKPAADFPVEFISQVLKEVVMHEVGHTLGLRHNFKASSWLTLEEIAKRKEGEPTVGSVMDYNPTHISPKGEPQGTWTTTTLGPYDIWAIEYGYSAKGDAASLKKIASRAADPSLAYATDEDVYHADPLVHRFDLGSEPLDYGKQRIKLVEQILDKLVDNFVKEGEGFQRVRRAFGMLLSEYMRAGAIAAKYVGGHYEARDHKGDPDARPPVTVVDAAKQRAALELLRDHLFSDQAFQFSPKLIRHLAAGRWYHWGSRDRFADLEYPIHDTILRIQLWALFDLLNAETLTRIQDARMRVDEDTDLLTVPELMNTLTSAIWSEVVKPLSPDKKWSNRKPLISSIRRNLQREYVGQLIDLALEGPYGYSPQVARTQAWFQLKKLAGQLNEKLRPEQARTLDDYTLAHVDETQTRIEKALDAYYSLDNGGGGFGGFFFFGRETGKTPGRPGGNGDPRVRPGTQPE